MAATAPPLPGVCVGGRLIFVSETEASQLRLAQFVCVEYPEEDGRPLPEELTEGHRTTDLNVDSPDSHVPRTPARVTLAP